MPDTRELREGVEASTRQDFECNRDMQDHLADKNHHSEEKNCGVLSNGYQTYKIMTSKENDLL